MYVETIEVTAEILRWLCFTPEQIHRFYRLRRLYAKEPERFR